MFIATANSLDTISPPLLDRCEVIECSGYVTEEKLAIAKKFLLPRQIKECGLEDGQVVMGDEALLRVIVDYTREVRYSWRNSPRSKLMVRRVYDHWSEQLARSVGPRLCSTRLRMMPNPMMFQCRQMM
jgi:ATP-dependent Lon protease